MSALLQRGRRALLAAAVGLGAALALAPAASASKFLTLGFSDYALTASNAGPWLDTARSEGARLLRYDVYWWQVEIRPPAQGSDPTDPANPMYSWSATDAVVRQDAAHGLSVVMMLYFAPPWAEGANIPPHANPGTWYPDPVQYGQFAAAAAKRYSGHYPDPLHPGQFLPRVRYWQPWNEPNLASYISPQWGCQNGSGPKCSGGKFVPLSPGIYRGLLNALYSAVKSVNPANFVVMAGTAPYGNSPPIGRMRPMLFYRTLFCLNTALKPTGGCSPSHLDALDAHPYAEGAPPTQPALNKDDVSIPDMWKIGKVARAGVASGHILPRSSKQLWVTETAYESRPPSTSKYAVSLAAQARYTSLTDYVLWSQGVNTLLWYRLPDAPPSQGDKQGTFADCGFYFYNGTPKPSAAAYRFPFYAWHPDKNHVNAWGRAPMTGSLEVSRRSSSAKWIRIARFHVSQGQVFQKTFALKFRPTLRARMGTVVSPSWQVGG